MAVKNTYKVPAKQWKKWSPDARSMFNSLHAVLLSGKDQFVHPKAPEVERKFWKTTAWNVAWIAADYASDIFEGNETVYEDEDEVHG